MKNKFLSVAILIILLLLYREKIIAQGRNIKELDFLVGEWKVREDNKEKEWWEETIRVGRYVLDSTYIELESTAVSSDGKERTYRWYIHFNSKAKQFEMVSMFGNWHKVQFDILNWEANNRKLTIRSSADPNSSEFHERFGEIVFDKDFNEYVWTGQNKYGDRENPRIWNYVEKGQRIR